MIRYAFLNKWQLGERAMLAQWLRDRGHAAHLKVHFINRLVFRIFAEDVELLSDHLFTAMARQGGKVGISAIDWFNYALFKRGLYPMQRNQLGAPTEASMS